MNKYLLILVVASLAILTQANAEYYKYIDENGNVVFTDNAGNIPENQRSKVKTFKEQQDSPSKPVEKDLGNKNANEKEAQGKLMDFLKREYSAKEVCPTKTKDQANQTIKATWGEMAQSMVSGDLEKALGFFSVFSRDAMRRRMSAMSKENMKDIFSNYKSIEINSLYEQDGIAEGGVIREDKSGTHSYPASFVRDPDCEWRIKGF
jgi:hypothetical protein